MTDLKTEEQKELIKLRAELASFTLERKMRLSTEKRNCDLQEEIEQLKKTNLELQELLKNK